MRVWGQLGICVILTAPLMAAEGLEPPQSVIAAAPSDPFWSLSSCIVFAQNFQGPLPPVQAL